jgi:uncharacterized protein (TIGR00661 family)
MKYLFIIQGEGRGHLTQAISLAQIIQSKGHEVVGALVGSCHGDSVQTFFKQSFTADIIPFASPVLVYSKKSKALSLSKTIGSLFRHFKLYYRSLFAIDEHIQELQPDVIVNFYDVLGGIHQMLFAKKAPMVCMAHQYLMLHKEFLHPKGNVINRFLVNFNTQITALGAEKKLALSFYKGESDKNIHLVPPLLRREVKKLQPEAGNYFLAYVTQQSMADEIVSWQKQHPENIVHCFSDKLKEQDVEEVSTNLFFHKIDGVSFLQMMQKCRGLISTAGFESVCEAMSLGKPVLMVPMKNHYEQTCNALDGQQSGAGLYRKTFAVSDFTEFIQGFESKRTEFSEWETESTHIIFNHLNAVAEGQSNRLGHSQTRLAPLLKSLRLHR